MAAADISLPIKRQPAESGWHSRVGTVGNAGNAGRVGRAGRASRASRAGKVGAAAVPTGSAESEKPVSPGRLLSPVAGNWKPAGAHAARAISRVMAVSFGSKALKRLKPEVVAPPAPLGGRHLAACVAHTHTPASLSTLALARPCPCSHSCRPVNKRGALPRSLSSRTASRLAAQAASVVEPLVISAAVESLLST